MSTGQVGHVAPGLFPTLLIVFCVSHNSVRVYHLSRICQGFSFNGNSGHITTYARCSDTPHSLIPCIVVLALKLYFTPALFDNLDTPAHQML